MIIKMAHGSGGKETRDLIETIFAKHFANPILVQMGDAAVVTMKGRVAMTTDSFVVTPLFFPGGDIGKLAICGTVNDLAMMGAVPKYLTAGFILEEGLPLEELERVVVSMAKSAEEAGVVIIAGDTKVIEGQGGLYINTSGIGMIPDAVNLHKDLSKEGDVVIVSGNLGDHHACILSQRMGIQNTICSDAQPLGHVVKLLIEEKIHLKVMRDVTRGGLGTVLNELVEDTGLEVVLDEGNLPVDESVAGLSSILGLDPLFMGNEGKFVLVVSQEDEVKVLELLHSTNEGKNAVRIGYLRKGQGVTIITKLGGRRRIDILYGEGLPRIC